MTVLARIGSTVEKKLITAIVRRGDGQPLQEKLSSQPGVLAVSRHHARGIGDRVIYRKRTFFNEKDVLLVFVEAEHCDAIFSWLYREGKIAEPHAGMLFVEKILRGHPMAPFDNADW